ncbi:RHS repeat-associated core domain-containing protein [Prevotella melaninogenica]
MTYDAAGNLLTKLTAELRKSISDKGYISYTYDFERLHEVLYPENLFNRVTYTYGKAGDKYNRAGRLALVEDASGGEAYYYGRQGEVTKTVRTVMASVADIRTYVYGATYDSWNRVQTMTYPDGEVVTYHYNAAGQVESLTSNKQGRQSVIVDRIGYDKEGHTVYTKLGNGTETTYTYDKQRERLQVMNLTADGQAVMENRYRYDAVDNILGITNATDPTSLTKLNRAKLGGRSSHTYEYDELNRLIHASGKAKRASYDMVMSFGRMSEPLTKVQKVDSTTTAKSYNFAYKYEDSNHPTAPTQIGHDHYTYDSNGNPTLVTNDSTNTTREMYWDEDNRLMVLSDNGKTSRYTYNAVGERIMKSCGTMEGVYINGAPQGITFHETDNFTLYPASILSVNKNRFTKHYFIGDKRIASRIGTGLFNNVYGRNGSYVTAGQQDYAERMNQIQTQKEAYYKKVGVAPGVPTEKGAYGDPENTGVGYNAVLTELGNHDVPQGWVQTPKPNTTPNTNPSPPVSWNDPSNPDDPQAGYGYIPNDTTREETFFYHSDHLGSTSYITDDKANITQYDAYLPYGELLVDEHSSSEELPYKFNGKQFDEETGLYYYGARYMNPVVSFWYGVDPLAEKYQSIGGYVYCIGNPVKYFDPDGNTPWAAVAEGIGTFVLDAGVDFLSNWILEGQDYKSAFKNVAWGAALLDGATSAAISAFVDGAGASRAIEKIVSSSKGRKVLGIVISVTQGMLTGIASDLETGKIKSFSDIKLLPRFLEATLSTLLENKLNKKADELLSYVSSTNAVLAQKLKKLERSIQNNKNKTRVARDRHKFDIARTNAHKAELKYARSRINTKVKTKAAEQTYKQFQNK